MLSLPPSVRIWLCTSPTDMRRSFDSLAHLARERIGEDPLSGHLFVFRSRRGDRLKILYWDGDGYAIWCKRLEAGTFSLPEAGPAERVEMSWSQLGLVLGGVDLSSVRKRKRYSLHSSLDK